MHHIRGCLLAAGLAIVAATPTCAAELKILAGANMKAVLTPLAVEFERTTGHKLSIAYDTTGAIKTRVQNGERLDLVISGRPILDDLAKQGKIVGASIVDIANSPMTVIVRAGAPQPDIGSTEDFAKALLAARSVAYTDPASGGASGVYVAGLIERLGLADKLRSKTKLAPPPGGNTAELVAKGDAEIGIGQLSEVFDHKGIDFVKALPPELKAKFLVAAGAGADMKEKEAVGALIKFLTSPSAAAAIKATGMDPV